MSISAYTPAALSRFSPRAANPEPVCSDKPVLRLEGVAQDVTSPALRARYRSPKLEYVRVGTSGLSLTHEFEPGWPPALRLKPGARYVCEVFECLTKRPLTYDTMPVDRRTDDGIVFHNLARPVRDTRDVADQRRMVRNTTAVWTDGLSVACSNQDESPLQAGKVYKVVVREEALSA